MQQINEMSLLNQLASINMSRLQDKVWSFEDLLASPNLLRLIVDNDQFRLIGTIHMSQNSNEEAWVVKHHDVNSFKSRQMNNLHFDDTRPLSEPIFRHFDPRPHMYSSGRPIFLSIRYTVKGAGSHIKNLRVLDLKLPEIGKISGKWSTGTQTAKYHLCAVVRVTKSKEERIRIHDKSGYEALPAEVGVYRSK